VGAGWVAKAQSGWRGVEGVSGWVRCGGDKAVLEVCQTSWHRFYSTGDWSWGEGCGAGCALDKVALAPGMGLGPGCAEHQVVQRDGASVPAPP
jgi:hypothetical protein